MGRGTQVVKKSNRAKMNGWERGKLRGKRTEGDKYYSDGRGKKKQENNKQI